jgi:hypothetical protein
MFFSRKNKRRKLVKNRMRTLTELCVCCSSHTCMMRKKKKEKKTERKEKEEWTHDRGFIPFHRQ